MDLVFCLADRKMWEIVKKMKSWKLILLIWLNVNRFARLNCIESKIIDLKIWEMYMNLRLSELISVYSFDFVLIYIVVWRNRNVAPLWLKGHGFWKWCFCKLRVRVRTIDWWNVPTLAKRGALLSAVVVWGRFVWHFLIVDLNNNNYLLFMCFLICVYV